MSFIKAASMKNLYLGSILLLILLCSSTPAMNNKVSLIKTDAFEVTLGSELLRDKFISAEYNEAETKLSFVTSENIHSILIYNEREEVEFMLPVMADRVSLGKSMFAAGLYRLGFNFENAEELTFAEMIMK